MKNIDYVITESNEKMKLITILKLYTSEKLLCDDVWIESKVKSILIVDMFEAGKIDV